MIDKKLRYTQQAEAEMTGLPLSDVRDERRRVGLFDEGDRIVMSFDRMTYYSAVVVSARREAMVDRMNVLTDADGSFILRRSHYEGVWRVTVSGAPATIQAVGRRAEGDQPTTL
jgi:hypothetical protein